MLFSFVFLLECSLIFFAYSLVIKHNETFLIVAPLTRFCILSIIPIIIVIYDEWTNGQNYKTVKKIVNERLSAEERNELLEKIKQEL